MTLLQFKHGIDAYFEECEREGNYPDEAGMILRLGIDKKTFDRYLTGEQPRYAGFLRCILAARLRRESIVMRDLYASRLSSPTGKLLLSRLPDRSEPPERSDAPPPKLTVEVLFGGAAEAFE
jgi:hypothetical protein